MIVALVSLSRAQTVDLGGYQLNSAALGLIPVLDHDLRGVVRCGDAKSANAKVDLVDLRSHSAAGISVLPSLHTNSDERGSFRLWVSAGNWVLIVRATCGKSDSPSSPTLLRVGQPIDVSRDASNDTIRVLNVEMQAGEVQVVRNGEPEMTSGMSAGKRKGPIY
jgi:hypothetical protein